MKKITDLFEKLDQNECWYITKQPLEFSKICYAVKILEEYIEKKEQGNFEDFFTEKAQNLEGAEKNHRMLNNAYYYGLIKRGGANYALAQVTEVFKKISMMCGNDFTAVKRYENIIIEQLEKIYLSTELDRESVGVRKEFNLYIMFTIYKFFILLGEALGSFKISLKEFKLFVGTIKKYEDVILNIIGIVNYREDSNFKDKVNIFQSKVEDNRINLLLKNIPYFEVESNSITLKDEFIEEIKLKIQHFETHKNRLMSLDKLDLLCKNGDIFSFVETKKNTKKEIRKEIGFHQRIVYGAPGTGKSYFLKEESEVFLKENVERVTFYDGYTNGQFVGSYKPVSEKSKTLAEEKIAYKYVLGPFLRQLFAAYEKPNENFLLIIEEINRAKADRVFGNVFQLLDRDAFGESEYSISLSEDQRKYLEIKNEDILKKIDEKGGLYLPNNLYIWSTMNSADHGVYPLDSAFKRRWDFKYLKLEKGSNQCEDYKIKISEGITCSWNDYRKVINNELLFRGIKEDRLIAPFFVKSKDFSEDGMLNAEVYESKILMYLFEDVLQHKGRNVLFDENLKGYSQLLAASETGKEIYNEKIMNELKEQNRIENSNTKKSISEESSTGQEGN